MSSAGRRAIERTRLGRVGATAVALVLALVSCGGVSATARSSADDLIRVADDIFKSGPLLDSSIQLPLVRLGEVDQLISEFRRPSVLNLDDAARLRHLTSLQDELLKARALQAAVEQARRATADIGESAVLAAGKGDLKPTFVDDMTEVLQDIVEDEVCEFLESLALGEPPPPIGQSESLRIFALQNVGGSWDDDLVSEIVDWAELASQLWERSRDQAESLSNGADFSISSTPGVVRLRSLEAYLRYCI